MLFTGTSANTTDITIWNNWTTSASTTSLTNQQVWRVWVTSTSSTNYTAMNTAYACHNVWMTWVSPPSEINEEALRQRREAEARQRVLADESRRRQANAEERAFGLLRSMLTEQQNRDLTDHGHFSVDAPSGRRYRIEKGRTGNVKVVDRVSGEWLEKLCIHQRECLPMADTMLMQKLLIETAEDAFRATANITRRDGGYDCGRGLLDAERLAQVLPFRRDAEMAAA